jgi:hypothetical protein
MSFWMRQRRWLPGNNVPSPLLPILRDNREDGSHDGGDILDSGTALSPSYSQQEERHARELLVMAQNHVLGLIVCFYFIFAICRFGFGWNPLKGGPPPPTYTIHIPGIA